jgi:GNAT superfamily N-acetyltransferase
VPGARFLNHAPCPIAEYRRLYRDVGARWHWHERLGWSDATLGAHLARADIAVWEAFVGDESAGYFELRREADGPVEIAYFGLLQPFIGRGLGGLMLTRAVDEAFAFGASRVWLHTCTLDSPNALPGYMARGFRPFGTQRLEMDFDGDRVIAERVLDDPPAR